MSILKAEREGVDTSFLLSPLCYYLLNAFLYLQCLLPRELNLEKYSSPRELYENILKLVYSQLIMYRFRMKG